MADLAFLSDHDVAGALAAWRLLEPVTLRRIPGGFTSNAWVVTTRSEQFVAKYTYDGQAAVERGLRGAEILAGYGFPAAAPLRTPDGRLTVPVVASHSREQPLAMLPFVSGVDLPLDGQDVPELIGRDLGRLHTILLEHYPPPDERAGLLRYVGERTPEIAAQPGLQALLDRTLEQLRAYEADTPATYGWAYGDWFGILRDPATGVHGWIDWGTLDWAPLLIDLVSAITLRVSCANEMVGKTVPERLQRMLDAYFAVAPMTVAELQRRTGQRRSARAPSHSEKRRTGGGVRCAPAGGGGDVRRAVGPHGGSGAASSRPTGRGGQLGGIARAHSRLSSGWRITTPNCGICRRTSTPTSYP